MLRKPKGAGRCRYKIENTGAQHNILPDESATYSETYLYDNKSAPDKNILTLHDYEADSSSKRNFYLITNNIPEDQVGDVVREDENYSTLSSISSSGERSGGEKLDTLRSGESLIKQFNFDTSKYNGDTEKCVAFWRTLKQTNLKPVKCTLLKSSSSRTIVEQTEEVSDNDYMWYKALVELQRRKMDEAAFATTSQQCKLCEREVAYSEFKKRQGQKYLDSELGDSEDIKCLNYWNTTQKQKVNAETDVQHSESLAELSTAMPDDKDKFLSDGDKQTCAIDEQNTMKSHDSERCKCGRIHCQCSSCGNDDEREILPLSSFVDDDKQTTITDEQSTTKSFEFDICKCRKMHCQCNKCDSPSVKDDDEMGITHSSPCVHDDKQSTEDQISVGDEQNTRKSFDSDVCKCRRMHCQCNKCDSSSAEDGNEMGIIHSSPCVHEDKQSAEEQTLVNEEQYRRKSLDSDNCKCRRMQCQCNNCDESSTNNDEIHSPLLLHQQYGKTCSSSAVEDGSIKHKGVVIADTKDDMLKPSKKSETFDSTFKKYSFGEVDCEYNKTEEDTKAFKGTLQKCDICQIYCKCWDHKIEMSKQFLDQARYELRNQSREDKSCETEPEEEKQVEEVEKFCIICGHKDCCCDGPRYEPRKPYPFIQVDEHMMTSLFTPKKDSSLSKVKSCTKAEQISQSALQKRILEHSKEDVCFMEKEDKQLNTIQQKNEMNKITESKKPLQKLCKDKKKFFITPEQRAKEISRNKIALELNKYGIPQVVRYANGRFTPKPNTSIDSLLSNNSKDFGAVSKDK